MYLHFVALAFIAVGVTAHQAAFGETQPLGNSHDTKSDLPEYKPTARVSGKLYVPCGSKSFHKNADQVLSLLHCLAEEFKTRHPDVAIEIDNSRVGEEELLLKRTPVVVVSDPFDSTAMKAFEEKRGYRPTLVPMCISTLAVVVNGENPIESLTLQEVVAVFSDTRKPGSAKAITTWGELGAKDEWGKQSIAVHGHHPATYTSWEFKKRALKNGDYRNVLETHNTGSALLDAVERDPHAIGFVVAGIVAKRDLKKVKMVKLKQTADSKPIAVDAALGELGSYPFSSYMCFALDLRPGEKPDAVTREFVTLALSKDAQKCVTGEGFVPLSAKEAKKKLKAIGVE